MSERPQRDFRDRRLTPEEAAADDKTRKRIFAEFPPKAALTSSDSTSLSELLKKSIRESTKSIDQMASEAGVPATLITSFLSGQRDIHLATADKLAISLGLELATE
jgi:hypothetical protein